VADVGGLPHHLRWCAAYSFIAPILTDQAGVPAPLVPLVLTGFGVGGSFVVGTILAGRFGDAHASLVTIPTPP
jgi:predicted MFS family arabinose efflux permease